MASLGEEDAIGGASAAGRWLEVERSDETDDEVVPEFAGAADGCCFSSTAKDDDVMAASDGRDTLVGREGLITLKWNYFGWRESGG